MQDLFIYLAATVYLNRKQAVLEENDRPSNRNAIHVHHASI